MYEEIDLSAPPSPRELIGDKLNDVMWAATKACLKECGLSDNQIYHAELLVQDDILDICILLSHLVKTCREAQAGMGQQCSKAEYNKPKQRG